MRPLYLHHPRCVISTACEWQADHVWNMKMASDMLVTVLRCPVEPTSPFDLRVSPCMRAGFCFHLPAW